MTLPGPLADLMVVEVAQLAAGPYCAKLLADLGARVIKIEPPGAGDISRRFGPFPAGRIDPNASGLFQYYNTNKESLTVDLSTPAGQAVLDRLLKRANVLVHDRQPGQALGDGLSYERCACVNPTIIVTAVTPFGSSGPYADFAGSDLATFNLGGLGYVSPMYGAQPGDPPLKAGGRQSDLQGGMNAAGATLAALAFHDVTGEGQFVDVSCVESVIMSQEGTVPVYTYTGQTPTRLGRINHSAPVGLYPTKDGLFYIFCHKESEWEGLVEMMGRPEWATAPIYAEGETRAQAGDVLFMYISEWTRQFTNVELDRLSQQHHLPFASVSTAVDLLRSEQLAQRDFWVTTGRDDGPRFTMPGAPYQLSATPWSIRSAAPLLGEHTLSVLEEIGLSWDEIQDLRVAGVI